jgi:hypothetical protein
MSLRRLSILFISLVGAGLLTGAALLASVRPVSAQAATPVIQSASLRLWPEYDKPGLLVIFDGTFSNTVTFPHEMVFTLPPGAHDIQATMTDASGSLLTQPWRIDGNKLTFTLQGAGYQVEYYVDTPLLGSQRNLSYAFQAPYTIKQLEIEVQQPARATNFSVVPQPESSSPGSDGLTYYRLLRSNVAAGQSLPITIQYGKADQGTSVTPAPAVPAAAAGAGQATAESAPGASNAAGQTSLTTILPWLLIGLGGLAFLGALAYYILLQRRSAAPATSPSVRRAKAAALPFVSGSAAGNTGGGTAVFCPKCGRQFAAEDQFCARCGAARRR